MVRSVPIRAARLSTPHVLLAVLVLIARLLGPAVPAQASEAVAPLVICHASGPASPPAPAKPASQEHDCLLCPACHLAAQAVLPATPVILTWTSTEPVVDKPAAPPPSTGPPHSARLAARPTGPPASSV